jgi:hypothetical protein
MSVYSSIILLHRPCLTAFDVDAESMAEKIAGWPNVAKAVVLLKPIPILIRKIRPLTREYSGSVRLRI